MRVIKQHIGEIFITTFLLLLVIWYATDAFTASQQVENLLLIVPIGILTISLTSIALFQLFKKIRIQTPEKTDEIEEKQKSEKEGNKIIFISMFLYLIYGLAIIPIGFDVATFIFIAAMMFLQGERKLGLLIIYPLIFSVLVSTFFSAMIPYPMPMLFGIEFFQSIF